MADRIKISLGATKKLGNYESLRIDVGAESDCEEDTELSRDAKRNELFNECLDFIKEALEVGLDELG